MYYGQLTFPQCRCVIETGLPITRCCFRSKRHRVRLLGPLQRCIQASTTQSRAGCSVKPSALVDLTRTREDGARRCECPVRATNTFWLQSDITTVLATCMARAHLHVHFINGSCRNTEGQPVCNGASRACVIAHMLPSALLTFTMMEWCLFDRTRIGRRTRIATGIVKGIATGTATGNVAGIVMATVTATGTKAARASTAGAAAAALATAITSDALPCILCAPKLLLCAFACASPSHCVLDICERHLGVRLMGWLACSTLVCVKAVMC